VKPRHSNSLNLVWRIAELEARHLNAAEIAPAHLLLGLCKVVDVDLPEVISRDVPDRDEMLEESLREVRKLRTIFRVARIDAKTVRRRLRRAWPDLRVSGETEKKQLRRSADAKDVFADAEHFAEATNGPVYPTHLLYAVLLSEDKDRDTVLAELNIDKRRWLTVAKRQVLTLQINAADSRAAKAQWN
jgi:ATP-dependent Clp protease ATP-binding subunit ClpC